MKRLLVFLLIIFTAAGLCACKEREPDPPAEVTHTVTFTTTLLSYSALAPETQVVRAGECAAEPLFDVRPTAGYVLIWTTDPSARTPYDFSAPVTGDLLLYATEIPRSYRVTYLTERGRVPASAVTSFTKETATIELPDAILDGEDDFGYLFLYWSYFDDPDSVVSEIEQGTEGDVILRAHVVPVTYDVIYHDAGDASALPQQYVFGESVSLGTPLWEGHTFLGWTIYMDGARTPVTELTPAFVKEHAEALFHAHASAIGLVANWEETQ